jgi:chromosome segregation ATPase
METDTHSNAWWFWGEGWSRFGAFGVAGGALILLGHALFPQARWFIAIFAVALMLAFGSSEWPYKKGQEDRLGDDLYYLGLTYTLVSVAHALYAFSSAANVDRLVSDFSVALLTTLVGIVGRVLLYEKHAARRAPAEIDGGMAQLRAEIQGAVDQMQQFRGGLAEHFQQATDSALKSVGSAFATFTTSANEMSEAAKVVNASLRKGASAFDKSFGRVEQASEALSHRVGALAEETRALGSVSEALNGRVSALVQGNKELESAYQSLNAQMFALNASLDLRYRAVEANIDAQNKLTFRVIANLDSLNKPVSLLTHSIDEMRQQIDAAKQAFSSAQLSTSIADAREAAENLSRNLRYVASTMSPDSMDGNFSVLKAFRDAITELTSNIRAQSEITQKFGADCDSLNREVSILTRSIDEMRQKVDGAKQDFSSAQLSTSIAEARDAAESLNRNLRHMAGTISAGAIDGNFSVLKAFGDTINELTTKIEVCTRKLATLADHSDQGAQPQNGSSSTAGNGSPPHSPSREPVDKAENPGWWPPWRRN